MRYLFPILLTILFVQPTSAPQVTPDDPTCGLTEPSKKEILIEKYSSGYCFGTHYQQEGCGGILNNPSTGSGNAPTAELAQALMSAKDAIADLRVQLKDTQIKLCKAKFDLSKAKDLEKKVDSLADTRELINTRFNTLEQLNSEPMRKLKEQILSEVDRKIAESKN
jgi:hypothetical protein